MRLLGFDPSVSLRELFSGAMHVAVKPWKGINGGYQTTQ
jgi:hypothetical protein